MPPAHLDIVRLRSRPGQDLNGKRRASVVPECLFRRRPTKDNPFLGNRVFGNKFRKLHSQSITSAYLRGSPADRRAQVKLGDVLQIHFAVMFESQRAFAIFTDRWQFAFTRV